MPLHLHNIDKTVGFEFTKPGDIITTVCDDDEYDGLLMLRHGVLLVPLSGYGSIINIQEWELRNENEKEPTLRFHVLPEGTLFSL